MNEGSFHRAKAKDTKDSLYLIAHKISQAADCLKILIAGDTALGLAVDIDARVLDRIRVVRGYLRTRRLREKLLPSELFGEPAWDILLDLYAAGLEGKIVSVSSACVASAVSQTTALRWLNKLIEHDLLERIDDEDDGRRANVQLTPKGRQVIGAWVEETLLNNSMPVLL